MHDPARRSRHMPRAALLCFSVALLGLMPLLGAAGCERRSARSTQSQLVVDGAPVVTSFSALQSWTSSLLDGIDRPVALFDGTPIPSASIKLTSEQRSALAQARLVILWGGSADRFAREAADSVKSTQLRILEVAGGSGDTEGGRWLDPREAAAAVKKISVALQAEYPRDAKEIHANELRLAARLEALDAHLEDLLTKVPSRDVLIEDAWFAPFCERYRLRVRGVLYPFPARDISVEDVEAFRKEAAAAPGVIFLTDSHGANPVTSALLQELSLRVVGFDPVETAGDGPDYYFHEMERNAANVALALMTAPPAPTALPAGK